MHSTLSLQHDAIASLLGRTAALALSVGLDEHAQRIFAYLREVLADPGAVDVSCALVRLGQGREADAVALLRDGVLRDEPLHDVANVVLGIALLRSGLPGARACFETVLACSDDPVPRAAALDGLTGL